MPSFELMVMSTFASILPGTSKRSECATELLLLIKLPVNPDIAAIVNFLLEVPTGATKSAPRDLSPFFRSSNK